MGNLWFSFILGAGGALFIYLKGGKSIGYGNQQTVWTVTLITFFVVFGFVYTLMRYVVHTSS